MPVLKIVEAQVDPVASEEGKPDANDDSNAGPGEESKEGGGDAPDAGNTGDNDGGDGSGAEEDEDYDEEDDGSDIDEAGLLPPCNLAAAAILFCLPLASPRLLCLPIPILYPTHRHAI